MEKEGKDNRLGVMTISVQSHEEVTQCASLHKKKGLDLLL